MTEIRDLKIPAVEGEARSQAAAKRARSALALLWISAALLTIANLGAATYLYRTAAEFTTIAGRLDQIAAFEERIKAKLDQMNNGVQAQFDRQNGDLQGRFGAIYERFGLFEQTLLRAQRRPDDLIGGFAPANQGLPQVTELPPAQEAATDAEPVAAIERSAPKPPAAKAPPRPSPAYQRVEAADGKVYYRKVR